MRHPSRGMHPGWILPLVMALILAACSGPARVEVPLTFVPTAPPAFTVLAPTPEPPEPTTLIICLFEEPSSLYLYGDTNRATDAVLQAVYDGPMDVLGFEYRPVILEKVPSLADGDARIESVMIASGDVYLNPETLLPDTLDFGKAYLPAGCEGPECLQTYSGGEVAAAQLAVDFRLLPGITWSDGTPLTAADSVFSFQVEAHIDTPSTKYLIDRTFSYEATGELSVRWVGIPGFLDGEYQANFWSPLPQHQLGDISPARLLTLEETTLRPTGWGPFVIDEWQPGRQILLSKNPNYFRSREGLPGFDFLIYRFLDADIAAAVQQILTGECDILDEFALDGESLSTLVQLQEDGRLSLTGGPGPLLERLEFNLAPIGGGTALDLFGDDRTRRGLAACIDRSAIVEEVLYGFGQTSETYLGPGHPGYFGGVDPIQFDAAAGGMLLEEAGWVDADADPVTPRVASGVMGVPDGTLLSYTYLTTPGDFHEVVAQALTADLAECGAGMEVEFIEPESLFAPWPDGPAFGRQYETLGWSWPIFVSPTCEMFIAREIPAEANPFGVNASGFSDPDYDRACDVILLGLAETDGYREAVRTTQEILRAQLPAIPLFQRPRVVAHANEICGLLADASPITAYSNLEAFRTGEACARG